ncbi:hypothetical protein ACPCSL_34265 [Streptomyces griseoincarnatus]|uniref:hypothetical protein n=1 Tax=Streptomyces TaxID=1883 RepID=UPI001C1DD3D5|nr:hypothetical protein [Streptomyces sp. PAM3C]MBU5948431.1 hypothetical protein [Streptomyces sp. PAM3C]
MRDDASVESHTQSHLLLDPDVPSSAYDMAQQIATEQAQQEEAAIKQRRESVSERFDVIRRRVRDLFDSDGYLRFRQFLRSEQLRVRELMLPPDGLTADSTAVQRDRHERAEAFLREHRVAPEEFRKLVDEHRNTMTELLHSPLVESTGTAYSASKFLELAEPKAEPRAFAIRPPFDDWQRGWHFANLAGNGFTGDRFVTLVPRNGIVGQQVQLTNLDASDFDFAEAVSDAQIAFWFRPGMSGTVRMWIEAQCQLATHSLRTVDEWGFSESSTTQTNFHMMHVLHPNIAGPSFAATSDFIWRTDETEEVFRQFVPTGTTVISTLSSNGTIPANTPVAIRAGTRTIASSFTNDVEIHNTPDFRWVIRSISIQMV